MAYGVCSQCGSINKILTEEEYRNLGASYDPGGLLENHDEKILRLYLSVDKRRAELESVSLKLPARGISSPPLRLLDIGCGMGGYLLAGRELGFDVYGVEPSESHSYIGRQVFGLPITTAYFDKSKFDPASFDLVVLSHVIEHIFDPAEFMIDVAQVLKPNGVILVLTPNAGSTLAAISGSVWSMLAPVDHVTMMTPDSLRALTPSGFAFSVRTDENLWEPAVVLLQALRNRFRSRRLASSVAAQPEPAVGSKNSFRGTIAVINSNVAARSLLSLLSLPMWLADRAIGRAHCLVAQYRKPNLPAAVRLL